MEINTMIGVMVAILVGVIAVLPVINDTIANATTTNDVVNETMTCTNATTRTLANANIISDSFVLVNGTVSGNLITSGNYTVDAKAGKIFIQFSDTTIYPAGMCRASYTYYPAEYQTNSSTRQIMGILPIFVVIALLMITVGVFMRH